MTPNNMKNETLELAPADNRVQAREASAQSSLLTVIERAATNKDLDVARMKELLDMHERICAKQAEQEFNDAMRSVQSEVPRILRDATNPSTNSRYTRLESLLKIIVPIYTQHGFSISFGTSDCPLPSHYRITAAVSHRGGHSRPYQCDIPVDNVGMKGNLNKTATHGFGSTMSYGRRYLTLLIFNIALVNEDDDKQSVKPSVSARVATAATREWALEQLRDIHLKLRAYLIDTAAIMPDEGLTDWPLTIVPTTKGELAELRRKVEAHA